LENQGQNEAAERPAHDLVFPNGEGKPDGHFLRKLKAIAKLPVSRAQSFTASASPLRTRCTKKGSR
jgi:hypothetical protein